MLAKITKNIVEYLGRYLLEENKEETVLRVLLYFLFFL